MVHFTMCFVPQKVKFSIPSSFFLFPLLSPSLISLAQIVNSNQVVANERILLSSPVDIRSLLVCEEKVAVLLCPLIKLPIPYKKGGSGLARSRVAGVRI